MILSTIPTSCAILPTMFCVIGVHRRVVEGRGVGSPGCVVHVHVYGDRVLLWNVIATEHSRYGLSCTYVETIECMSSAGSV